MARLWRAILTAFVMNLRDESSSPTVISLSALCVIKNTMDGVSSLSIHSGKALISGGLFYLMHCFRVGHLIRADGK